MFQAGFSKYGGGEIEGPFFMLSLVWVGDVLCNSIKGIGEVMWLGIIAEGFTGMEGEGVNRSLLVGVCGEDETTWVFLLALSRFRLLATLVMDVGFCPLALNYGS